MAKFNKISNPNNIIFPTPLFTTLVNKIDHDILFIIVLTICLKGLKILFLNTGKGCLKVI